jgi:hypothetical protein
MPVSDRYLARTCTGSSRDARFWALVLRTLYQLIHDFVVSEGKNMSEMEIESPVGYFQN